MLKRVSLLMSCSRLALLCLLKENTMSKTVKLSNRLKTVASYVATGAHFADIGSDHAFLPCYVCLHDKNAKVIAGELNDGPFNRALDTVTRFCLTDQIDIRLGDGLDVIETGEVNQIVIAGMGGDLIKSILEHGKQKLGNVERIIVQPNIDERYIREWLFQNGYSITDETIMEENGHTYEIIVADKHAVTGPRLNDIHEQQMMFGPVLLQNKANLFYRKWKFEKNNRLRIIAQMKRAKIRNEQKLKEFEQELIWIKEVLDDENDSSKC